MSRELNRIKNTHSDSDFDSSEEDQVTATRQVKGLGINEDDQLVCETGAWGARAAPSEATERVGAATSSGAAGPVQITRLTSHFGIFEAMRYAQNERGVEIELTFKPGSAVDATKIGLPQTIKAVARGIPFVIDPAQAAYMVPGDKVGAGYMIDGMTTEANPIYGAEFVVSGDLKDTRETNNCTMDPISEGNASYQLGHRFSVAGTLKTRDAWMYDCPIFDSVPNSSMIFETAALALDGAQKGTYYGSVKWGWETDDRGTMKKFDLELISAGMPSANFLAAANQWNSARARGTVVTAADPTEVYDGSLNVLGMLPKDTRVKIEDSASLDGVNYNLIRIDGDPDARRNVYIKTADLKDLGDGPANTQLPVADVQVLSDVQEVLGADFRTLLAPGTRVVKTSAYRDLHSRVWVKVVAGPYMGVEGYVDAAKLIPERSHLFP